MYPSTVNDGHRDDLCSTLFSDQIRLCHHSCPSQLVDEISDKNPQTLGAIGTGGLGSGVLALAATADRLKLWQLLLSLAEVLKKSAEG